MNNKKLKIAVYAICKNEEKFVDSWVESMSEADRIFVLDTGSTDNTVNLLKKYDKVILNEEKFENFRFDVARNKSLNFIPEDYDICVCTDLDERFEKGWRNHLEQYWKDNTKQANYRYTWNFDDNGNEGYVFFIEKMHTRKNFIWTHPVHEVLKYTGKQEEYLLTTIPNIQLNHYADESKPRKFYLDLLELSVKEDPLDDRNMHYLAREYYFNRMYEKSIETFKKHLLLPQSKWNEERANSYRYMSKCYLELNNKSTAILMLHLAINECRTLREPFLDLAIMYYNDNNFLGAYFYITEALKIKNRSTSYINEANSWNDFIYDLGSVCAIHLGLFNEAKTLINKALEFNPNNERIKNNLIYLENLIKNKK